MLKIVATRNRKQNMYVLSIIDAMIVNLAADTAPNNLVYVFRNAYNIANELLLSDSGNTQFPSNSEAFIIRYRIAVSIIYIDIFKFTHGPKFGTACQKSPETLYFRKL